MTHRAGTSCLVVTDHHNWSREELTGSYLLVEEDDPTGLVQGTAGSSVQKEEQKRSWVFFVGTAKTIRCQDGREEEC